MQHNSPPPVPTPAYLSRGPEIVSAAPHVDDPTSSLFDWSDFLDFDIDQPLDPSFLHNELEQGPEHGPEPELDKSPPPDNSGRVRKRDPRLLCSNFVAGRIPCACPELDKKLEEEEESAHPGKKRARRVRASTEGPIQCQVPGCDADISELKGYHKRHRVCLQCANASSVMFSGEEKRYCQQCGKFHALSNFDEGKRSCQRKLNIHNDRRRRKSNDLKGGTPKEAQQVIFVDDDAEKDETSPSSQSEEKETLLESDVHVSTIIRNNELKHSPKFKHTESYHENQNKFSSVCPTGRISFKLYDWNPAEFPRRLRLQIFEWLASMPIELEGYIRPGCTILTAFIAMPNPMWLRLLEKPASYIEDLVMSPGNMLFGRGSMLVYLNDMIFRVTKDSVVQISLKDRSPKLHYIHPTCFEAGKPLEFVACGSNLLQPKFRFLVSFAGRYQAYNICVSSLCCDEGSGNNFEHQLVKISVPQTDMNVFGPAFIEVENQSGLSNFIPILIGDKEMCEEMEILQQKSDISPSSQERASRPRPTCEVLALRQNQFSGFLLDLAWSLKKPVKEQPLTSSHVQRFDYLLSFLIEKESSVILRRVVCSLKSAIDNNMIVGISDLDITSLQRKMRITQSMMLDEKLQEFFFAAVPSLDGKVRSHGSQKENQFDVPATNMGVEQTVEDFPVGKDVSSSLDTVPLINGEVVMNINLDVRPRRPYSGLLVPKTFLTSRLSIAAVATVCVCFGVCEAVFHPQRVGQIATTIRRCLFDSS